MRIAPETPHTDCCAGSQGPPSPPPAVPKHDALKDERISYAIRYAHYEPRAQDYRRGHRRTRPIALRGARTRHHADELARSGLRRGRSRRGAWKRAAQTGGRGRCGGPARRPRSDIRDRTRAGESLVALQRLVLADNRRLLPGRLPADGLWRRISPQHPEIRLLTAPGDIARRSASPSRAGD